MLFRREEPFRFTFGDPIKGTFRILQIDGISGHTKEAPVLILDLSPNGVKFSTHINLPIEKKRFLVELTFVLNEKQITMLAEPKWKKLGAHTSLTYGLVGLDNIETKKEIIDELKEYSRRTHQTKLKK